MLESYSSNNSYSDPLSFGSLSAPIDGNSGGVSDSIAIWIKNTGTSKLFTISVMATNGSVNATGGVPSSNDDAFITLALDNNSNLPDRQTTEPPVFIQAPDSDSSPVINITNTITSNGVPKTATTVGSDSDYRTMLPGEYVILWVKAKVDDVRSPGGSFPTPLGMRNIKLSIGAIATEGQTLGGEAGAKAHIYIETTVAQWHLDENEGLYAYDSYGANHGLIDGAVWWNIGIGESSLQFDGGDSVDCGDSVKLNPVSDSMTIEAWLKSPEDNQSSGSVVSKTDGTSGYEISLNSNGEIDFFLGDTLGNSISFSEGVYLNDTGWHGVTLIIDRVNDLCYVYVDKVKSTTDYDISSLVNPIENSEKFYIGKGSTLFSGRIDEVAVYNRILSNSEVISKYDQLWDAYLSLYGITDDGDWVMDGGRHVVDEVY